MPDFALPLAGVKYRIRNVDYGTFLTRRATDESVVLRGKKDTPLQHWVFDAVLGTSSTYFIKDPDDTADSMLVGQTAPAKVLKTGDSNSTGDTQWMFATDHLDHNKTYIVSSTQGKKPNMVFQEDANTLSLESLKNMNVLKSQIKEENYQWELVEVAASDIPEGKDQQFRIRTLLGVALQLDASDSLTLDKEDRRGSHRAWTITDHGNGRCVIYNSGAKKYLTTVDKGSFDWKPAAKDVTQATEEEATWIIKPSSEFTYSICVERTVIFQTQKKTQILSLSLDQGNAILKPKKAAHNQMWLIEPEDAAVENPVGPNGNNGSTGGGEVAPGLAAGKYKLRSMDTRKFYVSVTRVNTTYNVLAETDRANKLNVEPKGNGVVLYSVLNGIKIYLVGQGNTVVGQVNSDSYIWTLTQGVGSGQYFIGNSSGQVIACPTALNTGFTLEATSGEARKLWQFVP